MIKYGLYRGVITVILFFGSIGAFAQETGHYPLGVEGIKAASLLPPGVYFRSYNILYKSDRLVDHRGDKQPFDFKLTSFASAQRLLWVTDTKLLGGDLAMDMVVPLVANEFERGPFFADPTTDYDREENIGDISIQPLAIAWHGKQWDAVTSYMLFIPTGEYDNNEPASIGKNFWSHVFSLGGTVFFDEQRKWHISALARYEIHSEKDDEKVTPGDDFEFEWGVGRTFNKFLDVGIAGYCHWQVTDDEGAAVRTNPFWDPNVHDKTFAIGPEVSSYLSETSHLSLRYLKEFDVEDRPEGESFYITFSVVF